MTQFLSPSRSWNQLIQLQTPDFIASDLVLLRLYGRKPGWSLFRIRCPMQKRMHNIITLATWSRASLRRWVVELNHTPVDYAGWIKSTFSAIEKMVAILH